MPPKRGSPQKKPLTLRNVPGDTQPTISSTNADKTDTDREELLSDSHESMKSGTGNEPRAEETQEEIKYRKLKNNKRYWKMIFSGCP